MQPETPPKFVRRYAAIYEAQVDAIRRWSTDVRDRKFPGREETYD
jgi:ketopantoate hydroxymethyltransferase